MTVEELIKDLESLRKDFGDGLQVLTTSIIEPDISTWPLKEISVAQVCVPIETEYGLAYPMVEDELAFPGPDNKLAFPGPEDDKKYGKHAPGCVIVLFP